MMSLHVRLQTIILVSLLVAAYASYSVEPTASAERALLLDAKRSDLLRVDFVTETGTVSIDLGRPDTVQVTRAASDYRETFTAKDEIETLLQELAPMHSLRSLGQLPPADLSTTGLLRTRDRLRIEHRGGVFAIELGGRTIGSEDRHARLPARAEIHLLPRALFDDLEQIDDRFKQRSLLAIPPNRIHRAALRSGGRAIALVKSIERGTSDSHWQRAQDRRNDPDLDLFFDHLGRLEADQYLELLPGVPVFEIEWLSEENERLAVLRVHKQMRPNGEREYFAEASSTRAPVTVSAEIAKDLERRLDELINR